MSYVECVDAGEQLLATAHKVSRNRPTAVDRVDVTQDKDIIAAFTGTVYKTKQSFDQVPA
jgi:acyl-coenzyme A thioesterase PaaI-like protein